MIYNKIIIYLIYAFVFLVPLLPFKIKIAFLPLSIDFLLIAIMAFILILMLFKNSTRIKIYNELKKLKSEYFVIAAIIYSIICIFSIIAAINKTLVIVELIRYWTYIFIYFVITCFIDNKVYIKNLVKLMVLSIFLSSILGLYQYIFNISSEFTDSSMGYEQVRAFSTFSNPNFYAAFIIIVIFPILMLALKKVKYYIFLYIVSLLLFLNLIFTLTRGAWIGFAIGILIMILLYNKKFILPLIAAISTGMFIPGVFKRAISMFDLNSLTISERFKLWKTGYYMFRDNPILGVGNGNYLVRYKEYITMYPALYLEREQFSVHNTFLRVASETGILGFILFMLVIVFYFKNILDLYKSQNKIIKDISLAFICSIIAYLFQNISNDLFFVPQVHVFYWIIGSIIISYNKILQTEKKY